MDKVLITITNHYVWNETSRPEQETNWLKLPIWSTKQNSQETSNFNILSKTSQHSVTHFYKTVVIFYRFYNKT